MSDLPPKLLIVLGTRPEIIKLAPVIRTLETVDTLSFRLLHTGQHYDNELSDSFFRSLNVPAPADNLKVGSGTQAEQTAAALTGIETEISEIDPAAVLALGDTNAVLSAALAASKMDTEFVHLEAGIRSFDRTMPEETNRVVADQLADVAFAPTETAVSNLRSEGISDSVHMCGNTIVDACLEHAEIAREQSDILTTIDIEPNQYVVATIHRPLNTNNEDRLRAIVKAFDAQSFDVLFPVHPRTAAALDGIGHEPTGSLRPLEPLDYLNFIRLLDAARVAVTDSGGIQEEASILEIPCLTVRPNTERPETVKKGVNELVNPAELQARLAKVVSNEEIRASMTGQPNLYGEGDSAERIVDALSQRYW